ncbi:ATPase domain-containing protein [Piscinibacter gummiphilus]|uniref:Circadian clock protein KaiC n=1 Tax=Piscinibacter gummiphilus TaxID=946333 RepID=A0A1W6L2V8_9BURK|nr:ATPase domain-containing protein [Piscinibacter gummiphilus]ARN18540.1 circadian clock protein KaiC [Piscinibacter gummiphilus]ATU63168.1 circadian clock protein KaiC [Piscinibacter gummiphilus]GLS95488.1 circadian clock protein KaiC [Piscinibacter gummiphilus]
MYSGDVPQRVSTGVSGLDAILGGGFAAGSLYVVEGTPGTGKTTLALQFLRAGVPRGETGLYITLSETAAELRTVVASHGWTLEGIEVHELVSEMSLEPQDRQSVLMPSEIELGETIQRVVEMVEGMNPTRVVFDSLSEMRLLADEPLRYRRQILALKHFFAGRRCTVLLLDDKTSQEGDAQLHSIAHGVVSLTQDAQDFGIERRSLRIVKMRGMKFQGGSHDLTLDTGGMKVFPRLVASEHHMAFDPRPLSTGTPELDALLGGGLCPGTNTLVIGPSGIGKTTTAVSCMLAALRRGEAASYFLFEEGLATLLSRSSQLGLDLSAALESGQLQLSQVDPAALSPGEFASRVVDAVRLHKSRFVVIDSFNAYIKAMPDQPHMVLHAHELLTYLNQQGVTTLVLLGQHGLVGESRSDVDLSYLSDVILALRFFENKGQIHSAVTCVKSRVSPHERAIREFQLGPTGVRVGAVLADFESILSGLPTYRGGTAMLQPPLDRGTG